MHTRSAKDKITGKFTVTVWDFDGNVYFKGEFDNVAEADRAAEEAERRMTMDRMTGGLTPEIEAMTIEEILAELEN